MDVMSLFRSNKPQQPQVQQPGGQQQQNQQQQQQNPAGKANEPGNINNPAPGSNSQNAGNGSEADPFAKYANMFNNTNTEADAPPAFNLDSKVLGEIAGKQDFMQGIDPELMTRATSGDTSALIEIMHSVSRNAYKTSLEHSGLLTDKFVGAREAHSSKGFGKRVKGELTQAALANTPNFKNPVVRQQLSEVASRLQQQHPDAAPEEIADMAKDYITQLAGALNPNAADRSGKQSGNGNNAEERGEEYWNDYFSGKTAQS